jgi:hypothetical protein
MLELMMQAAAAQSGAVLADAIDLDGTNDYQLRVSDLTGNADGKTFTFGAWVWVTDTVTNKRIYGAGDDGASTSSYFEMDSSEQLRIQLRNTSGTVNLNATLSLQPGWNNTWTYVLISIDLANSANRYVFINDADFTSSVTWTTYSNSNVDWTQTNHRVGRANSGNYWKGRLSHVFLDYTYRDLSIEANRRLFITADRKPTPKAALKALNPILYLPMDDPTTAHINEGTGGNFTLNGVIARSGRGPSQFNAPYSDLDGSADYLSRTARLTGLVAGKQFTSHFCVNSDAAGGGVLCFHNGTDTSFDIRVGGTGDSLVQIYDVSGNLSARSSVVRVTGRNYVVSISIDMANTSKRHLVINGVIDSSVTWTAYVNGNLSFATPTNSSVGAYRSSGSWLYLNGRLGNVFFHTSYIDLSIQANREKFVTGTGIDAKPADLGANGELPFGTAPLIYLPMYGNNAGKNYGTGGNFTVSSGPFPGARGPNEFWGNKADFDGSSGCLARTSALSISNGKTFSFSFYITKVSGISEYILYLSPASRNNRLALTFNSSNELSLIASNSSGTAVLSATSTGVPVGVGQHHICGFIDLTNTANRGVYVDGASFSMTWNTYTNDTIDYVSGVRATIGANWTGATYNTFVDSALSEFYFTTDYIDFSQEANRLLFRDAFGNPVALLPQIEAGTLPNPAIYLRFDPANQGKNDGTGGDFTKSGTINDGGQL